MPAFSFGRSGARCRVASRPGVTRLGESVCELEAALVVIDRRLGGGARARLSRRVSGRGWRAVRAPCSVIRAGLYVTSGPWSAVLERAIGEPGSASREPWPAGRDPPAGDRLAVAVAGSVVRDPRATARRPCTFLRVLVAIL